MLRRSPLALAVILVLAAALVPASAGAAASAFPQGVASYATHDSAVLWARASSAGKVKYQVAKDSKFEKMVDKGSTTAGAEHDFVVQPLVTGLSPKTTYHFRFTKGEGTAKGKFRTLPSPTAPSAFDFSLTADSDVLWKDPPAPQDEPMSVLRRIKEEKPNFWIYLGDTIYSDSETGAEPALTLEEKWAKYRANRVPAAKALMKSVSTWAQWDDHEFINDFDGAVLSQTDPDLFAAGMNAFMDYFPIPDGPTYRRIDVGSNADFFMLDERSFRTQSADELDSPCRDENGALDLAPQLPPAFRQAFLGKGPTDPACLAHLANPSRTMLGDEQKQWLKDELSGSDATWKFIINEVTIAQLFALPYDRWEGYQAERTELLEFIRDENIENVVFLTTDIHANWSAPLYADIADYEDTHGIAYEIVSGPIQTCTLKCEFDKVAGEGGTESFFNGLKQVQLIDLDCVNFNSFAYANVAVPSDPAAPLHAVWGNSKKAKGGGGKRLPDLGQEGAFCDEEVPVGLYPASTDTRN
jgi:phosphodiesterase/alkaline phosphatase D-like protein